MKKFLPLILIVIIGVGAGGFYAGMKYAGKAPAGLTGTNSQNLQNLSPEERSSLRLQQFGAVIVLEQGERGQMEADLLVEKLFPKMTKV
jgi:hypothetical protein